MQKLLRSCAECGNQTSRLVVRDITVPTRHDQKSYQVTVANVKVFECENCKAIVWTDEADLAVSAELRKLLGLLQPEEIKSQRTERGLNQKQLAEMLGIPVETLCRWETGAQIQSQRFNDLLVQYFDSITSQRQSAEAIFQSGS